MPSPHRARAVATSRARHLALASSSQARHQQGGGVALVARLGTHREAQADDDDLQYRLDHKPAGARAHRAGGAPAAPDHTDPN
eukprot:2740141-Prymnesium_polylepis.1